MRYTTANTRVSITNPDRRGALSTFFGAIGLASSTRPRKISRISLAKNPCGARRNPFIPQIPAPQLPDLQIQGGVLQPIQPVFPQGAAPAQPAAPQGQPQGQPQGYWNYPAWGYPPPGYPFPQASSAPQSYVCAPDSRGALSCRVPAPGDSVPPGGFIINATSQQEALALAAQRPRTNPYCGGGW